MDWVHDIRYAGRSLRRSIDRKMCWRRADPRGRRFAPVAAALAAIGIDGVMAYSVAQRHGGEVASLRLTC